MAKKSQLIEDEVPEVVETEVAPEVVETEVAPEAEETPIVEAPLAGHFSRDFNKQPKVY